jgi:hypothetical protein
LTLVVLLVLAALWAVVLVPPLLRSRMARAASADPIGDFNQRLVVLSRTNGAAPRPVPSGGPLPRAPAVSRRPALAMTPRAMKRRRDVLSALVIAVFVTIALAYFTGSPYLWGLHLAVDLCLLAFGAVCAWARKVRVERAQNVRVLAPAETQEVVLRRTGSS